MFAARQTGDAAPAARAWEEFLHPGGPGRGRPRNEATRLVGPAVLRPVDEAMGVSTNDTAQWGLAAMQCLALVGDRMPRE